MQRPYIVARKIITQYEVNNIDTTTTYIETQTQIPLPTPCKQSECAVWRDGKCNYKP